jgi:hypothetical protein
VLDGERIFINGVNYASEAKRKGSWKRTKSNRRDVCGGRRGKFFYKPIAE